MYNLSQVLATIGGLILAIPYLKMLINYKDITWEWVTTNLPFSIAITLFTFGATVNYIEFGNIGMWVAQLFSFIPLVTVHIIATVMYSKGEI